MRVECDIADGGADGIGVVLEEVADVGVGASRRDVGKADRYDVCCLCRVGVMGRLCNGGGGCVEGSVDRKVSGCVWCVCLCWRWGLRVGLGG